MEVQELPTSNTSINTEEEYEFTQSNRSVCALEVDKIEEYVKDLMGYEIITEKEDIEVNCVLGDIVNILTYEIFAALEGKLFNFGTAEYPDYKSCNIIKSVLTKNLNFAVVTAYINQFLLKAKPVKNGTMYHIKGLYRQCIIDTDNSLNELCKNSIDLVEYARGITAKQINIIQLMTFYSIGRWIVEEQQQGKSRAKYGQQVIKRLSEALTEQYGRGFSVDTLENARKFFLIYQDRISETVFRKFAVEKSETVFSIFEKELPFTLPWSHYLQLMRIKDENERKFYEIEATNEAWGIRTLQRQYNSSLYERLALSREKDEVLRLASEGNVITKPQDIVKQPTVLEFLGLDEKAKYVESDLETAIINKLQKFLLELGKGYLFEARQKRFTFNEDNYYVDLVFYNRILRCYVLIDLKIDKLTHQDLGQMMMYVHYYDRYEKLPEENPTVGILLCKEKDDALVEITLPDDVNIYASEYQLYLPDKKELQKKLKEWIEEGPDL